MGNPACFLGDRLGYFATMITDGKKNDRKMGKKDLMQQDEIIVMRSNESVSLRESPRDCVSGDRIPGRE